MDHIVAVAGKAKVMSSRRPLPKGQGQGAVWRPIPLEDSAPCFHFFHLTTVDKPLLRHDRRSSIYSTAF